MHTTLQRLGAKRKLCYAVRMTTTMLHFGAARRAIEVGNIAHVAQDAPIKLDSGVKLRNIPVAYQTYGTLNEEKNNAILICHALTGDQYVASDNPLTERAGWWSNMVGAGKPIDTDKFFVICSNILGGCFGTYGPRHEKDGAPIALNFPVVTIGDMVRVQERLVASFGIERLFAVIGGSLGGMQVLQWTVDFPEKVVCAIPIATTYRHNAQNIAYHEIGRQAIMTDPNWRGGNYYHEETYPENGLAVARMTAHVTYLSEVALQHKFGRKLQDGEAMNYSFDANFQVESYLRYQGSNFVQRFDPNSYLYITKAADYFDVTAAHGGSVAEAFAKAKASFCVLSFSSDWLYTTQEARMIVRALTAQGLDVSFSEIDSPHGHDGFLLEDADYMRVISGYLSGKAHALNVSC